MSGGSSNAQPQPPRPAPGGEPGVTGARCCKRCLKPVNGSEAERFFTRAGLCFWCAYVDSQG